MVKTIPKQVLQGLKSIADETLEQGSKEIKKVVGLSTDMGDAPGQMLESQDKEKTSEQTEQVRQELGRNVEGEIDEIRKKKQEEEDRKEQEFLEKIKAQRQAEAEERNRLTMANQGSAFARGKKPTAAEMTTTEEFSKKKD